MTPGTIELAGGALESAETAEPEIIRAGAEPNGVQIRYVAASPEEGRSYPVQLVPRRLEAWIHQGDEGWIAQAPALNALGYGDDRTAALEDLQDSVRQYLEVLRDDPRLAPEVAHHAAYLGLLDARSGSWFASVTLDAPYVE